MNFAEFLLHYKNGQRHFVAVDLDDQSFMGLDLSNAVFEKCYLHSTCWVGSNLQNSRFIGCSLKCADFRNANLSNAVIQNCSVEASMFKGALVNNFAFIDNHCMSAIVGPGTLIPTDSYK